MKINVTWPKWKIWTAASIGVLLIADIALFAFYMRSQQEAPETMRAERDRLAAMSKQLDADVARGDRIRASLSKVGKDSDSFYQESFLDSRTAYSTVDSDILDIASKSGVKTGGFTDKRTEIANRNVSQLEISMTVEGDYASLLKFVSGIEKSKNFYFLDQLQLGEGATNGAVRLQLGLYTYIRT